MEKENEKRVDRVKERLKEVISVFGVTNNKTVPQQVAATILRYFGIFPTEIELAEKILPELVEDGIREASPCEDKVPRDREFSNEIVILHGTLERILLRLIEEGDYTVVQNTKLLSAFRRFDDGAKGYLNSAEVETLKNVMFKSNTPFSNKDAELFFSHTKSVTRRFGIGDDSLFYYEDYISSLKSTVHKHIDRITA